MWRRPWLWVYIFLSCSLRSPPPPLNLLPVIGANVHFANPEEAIVVFVDERFTLACNVAGVDINGRFTEMVIASSKDAIEVFVNGDRQEVH
ncbi:hypothetical protein QJS10_CPB11g01258 [Acorus calamus]|uniref:Uncharacterized protein n=1 Tax=Acorus calamus TaxID=4465 RepID=A0AAV9DSH2_ACOCL|nr:hypothetical protein QJS10_CPB11g01258 [Acorus calamus]